MHGYGPTKATAVAAASDTVVADCSVTGVPGHVYVVNITTAGSAPGALYDTNDTSNGKTAANLIAVLPNTVGQVALYGYPYFTGLCVTTGTDQVASVAFY